MLTFPTHRHSLKRNFCRKKCFPLVNLFKPSLNRSHQEADICGEKISSQFHSLNFELFLIFYLKHVVTEVWRKFVIKHVFWMGRDFKAHLCLRAPPCPINLSQF